MDIFYRLTTIDESASILSDISYDKTDDSLVSLFYLFIFNFIYFFLAILIISKQDVSVFIDKHWFNPD